MKIPTQKVLQDRIAVLVLGVGIAAMPGQAAVRPRGVDVSNNNGAVNWGSVANDGISFAWAKATEGTYFIDGDFTANEANAKANGVFIGAYHFARPEDDPYASGADAEANYFWGEAGGYIKGGGAYMVPMLDFEVTGPSDVTTWVNEWCQDIKNKAAANGYTVNPGIYTTGSIASDMGSSVTTSWPLWIADPNGESSQSGGPTVSLGPWSTWTFWQYSWTGSVSGINGGSDEDVINGDDSTLQAFVIGSQSGGGGNSSTYYWDNNGGGGWSASVAHWSTSSSGGSDIDWANGKYAYFSAGSKAEGTASITISASGLDTTGIKIAQGNLTFNSSQFNLDAGPDKANYCLISVASGLTAIFNCTIGQNGTVGLDIDNGDGTVDLTAANSYKGGTYLGQGTLAIGNDSALGTGSLNLEGGVIQSSTSSAHTLANAIILSQDTTFGGTGNLTFTGPVNDGGLPKTFTVNNGITVTFSGLISDGGADAGAVNTLAGGGTLIFTHANTYNKPTVLNSGTMAIGNNSALGVGEINFEGSVIQSASSTAYTLTNAVAISQDTTFGGAGNLTFTGPVNDGGLPKTLTINNGITVEFDGVISDGGADVGAVNTLAGGGTLVLTGANTYNKPTVLDSGTIAIGNNFALGVGEINFAGSIVQSASSAAYTLTNAVAISQDTTFGGTGNLTFTGPVDDGGASKTLTINNGITVTFSGNISDGGAGTNVGAVNTLTGDGTLVFSGANSYYKPTVISSGTMAVGNNSALGTGAINFGGGAIQSASSAAYTLTNAVILSQSTTFGGTGNLTFTGPVSDGGASKTFTVNGGITVAFNGVVSDGGAIAGAVNTKTGSGRLVFGSADTYNKPTVISAGTLALGSGGSINNSPSISIAPGATFDVSATAYTLVAGQTLSGGGTVNGGVTVANSPTAVIHPGGGASVTTALTFNNNLTLHSATTTEFDLSSTYSGANDKVVLAGSGAVLIANGAQITINSSGTLQTNHDYVLFNLTGSSSSISGTFNTAPVWAGATPQYSAGFHILQTATQVLLHYTTPVTPSVAGITQSGGSVTMTFDCNPGYMYDVQCSSNVSFNHFSVVLTTNAPSNGQFLFTEVPPFNPAFYRLWQH